MDDLIFLIDLKNIILQSEYYKTLEHLTLQAIVIYVALVNRHLVYKYNMFFFTL